MPDVQHKRGSRADLNTLAAANGLLLGQIYVITDEDRLAVATGVGSYQAAEKEGGGGGGSALELYAENPSSPTSNTVTGANSVAIGSNLTVSGGASFAAGVGCEASGWASFSFGHGSEASGNYSIAMGGNSATASGDQSIAMGYGVDATGAESIAIGRDTQATASNAVAFGRGAKASGGGAVALGDSYASGSDSFAAAIASNSSSYGATGANSIAMGDRARATGANDAVSIGYFSRATGVNQSVTFGAYCQSTASYAFSAGYNSKANASSSVAIGSYASSDVEGKYAFSGDRFSSHGDAQTGTFVLLSDNTDDTPKALTTNKSAASNDNQVILPNNSAYFFSGTVIAREQASSGTDVGAWEIKGAIRREGNAGTTVLIKSTIDEFNVPTGWDVVLTADTTNGGLKIEVTGAASTNIRWVATVNTSEVTY
jgi:hypothetical protein